MRIADDEAEAITSAAFAPDGRTLATGGELPSGFFGKPLGHVKLWNVATGKLLISIRGLSGPPSGLKFGADGKGLIALGDGGEFLRLRADGTEKDGR